MRRRTDRSLIEVQRDHNPKIVRCRGDECGALIEWVVTKAGRRMPVNAPLVPLDEFERLDGSRAVLIDPATSHFATCPAAANYRRRQELGE